MTTLEKIENLIGERGQLIQLEMSEANKKLVEDIDNKIEILVSQLNEENADTSEDIGIIFG